MLNAGRKKGTYKLIKSLMIKKNVKQALNGVLIILGGNNIVTLCQTKTKLNMYGMCEHKRKIACNFQNLY